MNIYEIVSPLDQFEIREFVSLYLPILGNINISYTTIIQYFIISFIIIIIINLNINKNNYLMDNGWNLNKEAIYDTLHNIVVNQINKYVGQIYFPIIFSLFMFILSNNLIGMIPYSFATTSHFILTFSLSFSVVIGATILGFYKHKLKFFSLLVPTGCPLILIPLLVLIEFISYLARNISLGLRLAANVLSGHMLLNILSGLTYKIMNNGLIYFFIALLPLIFIIAFASLELGIAFIQAQVFVVLTASYIKDSLDLH